MNFEKILRCKIFKRLVLSALTGVMATSAASAYCERTMSDISASVVRFHILANSDSEKDQDVKLKVRDDVAGYVAPMLAKSQSAKQTEKILAANLKNIEEFTNESLKKYGCEYGAAAVLGNFDFPERKYENATFPSGNYKALRIILGNGEGHNWWCVLYPQLCFSSEDGALTEDGYSRLKDSLTEGEYKMITSQGRVNFKLKIVEMFSD